MRSNAVRRPALVAVSKAPAIYGFSRSTAYRLAERGEIKVVKLGRGSYIVDETVRIDELPELVSKNAA